MKISEIEAIIKAGISHLYDHSEAVAIARGYIEDKLNIFAGVSSREEIDIVIQDFFYEDLKKLSKGTPLQYVTGKQHFSGKIIKVTEAVLIPRPETEELVEWILTDLKNTSGELNILDIGTGSGCIPVMLKLKHPASVVYATDISSEALLIAAENAQNHRVEIHFREESILIPNLTRSEKYDIIVSNPPYIPLSESRTLSANVLEFEPQTALFSPDENPILFYKAVCDYAKLMLKTKGVIYFELNPDFAGQIKKYLKTNGFEDIVIKNDLSGRERFLKATRLASK